MVIVILIDICIASKCLVCVIFLVCATLCLWSVCVCVRVCLSLRVFCPVDCCVYGIVLLGELFVC